MATTHPALSLPPAAFELILGDPVLSTRDKCAVEATCRAWRDLARATAAVTAASVSAPIRLNTEERLDSLGLWLFHRADAVRHLKIEHFQCQRLDLISQNILLMVSNSLTSLSLTLSKHQRNRRGVPGPATLAWVPPLPALRRLDLTIAWDAQALDLPRWAPEIEELTLRWRVYNLGGLYQYDGAAAAMPPTLRRLSLYGLFTSLDYVLRPAWTSSLKSLSINWPGWPNGHNVFPATEPARIETALSRLTGLEELFMNVSTFGGDDEEIVSDIYGPPHLIGAEAALRAVSALTGLRTLKLAGMSINYSVGDYDRITQQETWFFDPLTRLETLHCFGGPFWGFNEAELPALTELALIIVAPNEFTCELGTADQPYILRRPGLKRLILNWDGTYGKKRPTTSGLWSYGWDGGQFDGAAKTLEELIIVETKRIAPLTESEGEEGDDAVMIAPEVLGPLTAAGRLEKLRLALGDGTVWGRRCVDPKQGRALGQVEIGKPSAELLAEVAIWGRWRLEREAGNVLEDGDYEDGELLFKCAVEATCRAWRDRARACSTAAHAAVAVSRRLDTEEKLGSLAAWLHRRADSVHHLTYEHHQHKRLDPSAHAILTTLAPSLTSLSLTLLKQYTRRPTNPAPSTFSWVPKLPALRCLDLTLVHDTKDWHITLWALNLEEMTLRWKCTSPHHGLQQFDHSTPALPPALHRFALFGCFQHIDRVLQPSWATNLRSLTINFPGWERGSDGDTLQPGDEASRAETALSRLTGLTELSLNVSCFGDKRYGRALTNTGGAAALRALSALTGLRTLKLASISTSLGPFDLTPLTQLETLHCLGGVVWGLQDAPLPALTELALIVVQSSKYNNRSGHPFPSCLQRPGIKRLILNTDSSGGDVLTSARWAEHGDFSAVAQTLEEVVIIETRWIAQFYQYSDESDNKKTTLPRSVVVPAMAARPHGGLRLAVGEDSSWWWGMRCLESEWAEELRGVVKMEKPSAEVLAEVSAWGRWRLESEPDDWFEDGDYGDPTPYDLWGTPARAPQNADDTLVPPEGVDNNTWKDYYDENWACL